MEGILKPCLVFLLFWLFFLPLPGLSLPRAQIHTKIATRGDIMVKVVIDSVMVNFMCPLDWIKGGRGIWPNIILHVSVRVCFWLRITSESAE